MLQVRTWCTNVLLCISLFHSLCRLFITVCFPVLVFDELSINAYVSETFLSLIKSSIFVTIHRHGVDGSWDGRHPLQQNGFSPGALIWLFVQLSLRELCSSWSAVSIADPGLFLECISYLEVLLENESVSYRIGHFRVHPGLCIKMRLSARPLIWKWFFIFMQIKLIFTRKVVHLASFWKWGFLEFGSGQLYYATVLYRLSLILLAVTRLHLDYE